MTQAMPQMGRQFVLGQTIQTTLKWLRTLVQTPLHS
jgi:hypothetical protein